MHIIKVSQSGIPDVESIKLESPVSSSRGSFTSPIYFGKTSFQSLGLQLGPANITGLVRTSHVCYLDITLSNEQLEWVRQLEAEIKNKLPNHPTVWFTRDMQEEDINYFFDTSLVGANKLRTRVQRCDAFDTIDVQVFKQSGEIGDVSLIEGEGTVLALIEVKGVCHRSGRISIDWVVEQVLVKSKVECKIGLGTDEDEQKIEQATCEDSPITKDVSEEIGEDTIKHVEVIGAIVEPEAQLDEENDKEQEEKGVVQENSRRAPIEDIVEIENIIPAGDSLALKSETELVADEMNAVVMEERRRRRAALNMFMEANGLDPDAYYFPDTDEEYDDESNSDEDDQEEEQQGNRGIRDITEVAPTSVF
jgi:hypothetical protein